MAFIEEGEFCSLDEYKKGLRSRLLEPDIRRGEYYMMMLRLDDPEQPAGKQAVEMLEIVRNTGLTVVRFAMLDTEFGHSHVTTEKIENDFVVGFEETFFYDPNADIDFVIQEAYLKDYFDDQFGDLLRAQHATDLALV